MVINIIDADDTNNCNRCNGNDDIATASVTSNAAFTNS